MANLNSPGVQVTIIDESFYTTSQLGTTPLFVVASTENKSNASSTGIAQGTLKTNAGKVYLVNSQRELADLFGDPVFRVDANNNPIHAGELNEYGLQAAYSFLGVSNSAFIVRADINLNSLSPQAVEPKGKPLDGTLWLNTLASLYGIFEWNGRAKTSGGQNFSNRIPSVVLDSNQFENGSLKSSYGLVGSYAVGTDVSESNELKYYYKSRYNAITGLSEWVEIGSDGWVASWPVITGTATAIPTIGDAITLYITLVDGAVQTTEVTFSVSPSGSLSDVANQINSATDSGSYFAASVNPSGYLEIYATSKYVDRIFIQNQNAGTALTALGITGGAHYVPKLTISPHTSVPQWKTTDNAPRPTGSIWIKSTIPNKGANYQVKLYNDSTQLWTNVDCPMFVSNEDALNKLDSSGGGKNLPLNTLFVSADSTRLDPTGTYKTPYPVFQVKRRTTTNETVFASKSIEASWVQNGTTGTFTLSESILGSSTMSTPLNITVFLSGAISDAEIIASAINTKQFTNIVAYVDSLNRVVISHKLGGEIHYRDVSGSLMSQLTFTGLNGTNIYDAPSAYLSGTKVVSNWISAPVGGTRPYYYISNTVPTTMLNVDGTIWYNSVTDEADIMIHDGIKWVGYRNFYSQTDTKGPIFSPTQPTRLPTNGTLIGSGNTGQLWIDTSDLENYPIINRWDGDLFVWQRVDNSDQTTENGIIFADARWATTGESSTASEIKDLLVSNFVDFDAPNPSLYPKGMLLWNLRRSGYNVKRFELNYVDTNLTNPRYNNEGMTSYYPNRWVSEASNQFDGSGTFGHKSQRQVVVQSLAKEINENQAMREVETNSFNLIATPGYPELMPEMVNLNYDRGLTSFIVGDSPSNIPPTVENLTNWGSNVDTIIDRQDLALSSYSEYLGVFYPWGLTTDNLGRSIVVPPSHMILRTIALSDQVSYPWFAPAGTRRGAITNASAVGYVTSEGEFKSIVLNEGQRDALYNAKVNPITYFTGSGLVNFGQKTRARNTSALDRINVARLVIYIRNELTRLAKPYIFEPNDKATRDQIKVQVESLLIELIGQRGIGDFLVVCDETNNTPTTIDRNELHVDVAIEPIKAVEFIYIPIRLKNTGEIASIGKI